MRVTVSFEKPISCHLYPNRVQPLGDFEALNYEQIDICAPGRTHGNRNGIGLAEMLERPLTRKYGPTWFTPIYAYGKRAARRAPMPLPGRRKERGPTNVMLNLHPTPVHATAAIAAADSVHQASAVANPCARTAHQARIGGESASWKKGKTCLMRIPWDEQSEEDQFDDVLGEEEASTEDDYDWEELMDTGDDLYGYKAAVDHSAEEDQRETPLVSISSMTESLRDQMSFMDLSEQEEFIAEQIIGSIDEDGYLRRPLESIVDDVAFNQGIMLSEQDVEDMLHRIQRLEPIGVASRDLRECLLVQLDMLPEEINGRDVAIEMLTHAYKAFTMKHFDQIMRRLDIEGHELKDAFELIQRLNPKPGEGEFTASENYITPDFTVRSEEDEFIITLNSGNAPGTTRLEALSADAGAGCS